MPCWSYIYNQTTLVLGSTGYNTNIFNKVALHNTNPWSSRPWYLDICLHSIVLPWSRHPLHCLPLKMLHLMLSLPNATLSLSLSEILPVWRSAAGKTTYIYTLQDNIEKIEQKMYFVWNVVQNITRIFFYIALNFTLTATRSSGTAINASTELPSSGLWLLSTLWIVKGALLARSFVTEFTHNIPIFAAWNQWTWENAGWWFVHKLLTRVCMCVNRTYTTESYAHERMHANNYDIIKCMDIVHLRVKVNKNILCL